MKACGAALLVQLSGASLWSQEPEGAGCVIQGGAAPALTPAAPVEELERRVAADTNDGKAYYELALGYWSEQRYSETERNLRQALAIEPRFRSPLPHAPDAAAGPAGGSRHHRRDLPQGGRAA